MAAGESSETDEDRSVAQRERAVARSSPLTRTRRPHRPSRQAVGSVTPVADDAFGRVEGRIKDPFGNIR